MKQILLAILLILTVACSDSQGGLVLYNANIIDPEAGCIIQNQTIHIKEGVIESIVPSGRKIITAIDLTGKYVMPGLIDSHVHWTHFAVDSLSSAMLAAEYLKCGVTSVRDMGGNIIVANEYNSHLSVGDFPGPGLYCSAMWVTGDFELSEDDLKGWNSSDDCPWMRLVSVKDSTDAAIEKAVIQAKESGCVGFKIYDGYSADELSRMIPIMKKHGMKVWAHSSQGPAKALDVVSSGVESVSHSYMLIDNFFYKTSLSDQERSYLNYVLQKMKDNDVLLDATAHISNENDLVYNDQIIKTAYAYGIKFLVGTDYFGCAVPDEIRALSKCGLSNIDILRAATTYGARVLGHDDKLGTIAEGAQADIIVLPANPIDDLSVLEHVEMTISNGKCVYGNLD